MTVCVGIQRSWVLKGVPASAGEARRRMRELLAEPKYAEWLDDAQLAMTELVTNVVLHAHTDLVLTVRTEHGRVCVQVRDGSLQLPVEWPTGEAAASGRGIALVRRLTSAYGAQLLSGGDKVVWFVMGAPADAGSPWPITDGPALDALGGDSQQVDAVEVVWDGVPVALWFSAVQQSADLMRELALYQADHPASGITRADLNAGALARTQAMRAIAVLDTQAGAARQEVRSLRLWVTPAQAQHFAALGVLYERADRLAEARLLLAAATLPEIAALRRWACGQVVAQLAGAPAVPWIYEGHFTEPWASGGSTVQGWDKSVVADSPGHVVAADGTNRIVAISTSLAAMLGWQVDELLGRRLLVLIPARLRSTHIAGFNAFLATGTSVILRQDLELPMLCSDGREITCSVKLDEVGTRVGHPVVTAMVTAMVAPVGAAEGAAPAPDVAVPDRGGVSADLSRFAVGDLARLGKALRLLGEGTDTLQAYAQRVCRYLYDHLLDEAGQRQTLLVRFYATVGYGELPTEDQSRGADPLAGPLDPDTTCLTLLATVGDQPSWNDRTASRSALLHPLTHASQIGALPMMAAIVDQLGIEPPSILLRRNRLNNAKGLEGFGVFHDGGRAGQPRQPTDAFCEKYVVRSRLGFGGWLPNGGLFGVMVFSRVAMQDEAVRKWETLAPNITLGAFARGGVPVFPGGPRTDLLAHALSGCQRLATQKDVLTTLLLAHERVSAEESDDGLKLLERATFETQRYAALARSLQEGLLPPALPVIADLEVGAAFRPAGDGSEIGGDFYDLFPTSNGRFGLALGDVSGKGVQAAALTSLARHTVRAAALHAPGACEVLAALDRAAAGEAAEGRYLTALFAFLAAAPGQVTLDLALGGHLEPLVLRADGRIESVGVAGGALGLFPDLETTEVRVVLRSGDVFVAYSDGVTEARCGDEEFGEARLRALLAEGQGRRAADLARQIEDAVVEFQRGKVRDDIAVVALRCP